MTADSLGRMRDVRLAVDQVEVRRCLVDDECTLTGRSFEGEFRCCVSCGGNQAVNKEALKAFKATVPVLREAREKGRKAFDKVGKRFR